MPILIHDQGHHRTFYDEDGHLQKFDKWSDETRVSAQTWPDAASAKKAFDDGLVTWEDGTNKQAPVS
jgi:hypothetical protein